MNFRLIPLCLLIAVVTACAPPQTPGMASNQSSPSSRVADPSFRWEGQQSRVDVESSRVATTAADWLALWQAVGREPPLDLPEGRFAVGIFLGQRVSGGYGIRIVSAESTDAGFAVTYEETVPAGPAASVISFPYLIRLFPATDLPVTVRRR